MSGRTFRRWRERYEAEGAAGLYDRRLGRVSARRAPVDEVMRVLELFETRYPDFTAKHFHEKLVCEHGFELSYNWLRLSLQAHGKIKPAPRRGAHRRKRPRRPVVGMMLHQDGSSHEWVAGQWWDLIVTMDDATSEVYSGFFVAEEGTMSTFRGLGEVIAENGLFCSLYADRASHYWHTPEAGGGVDKDNPTQVGRALAQLGIELIAAYSPQARGRSERMFGTLQKRLPQELRLAGIATMAEANRFLEELFWPAHNARFTRPAADTGSAFVAFAQDPFRTRMRPTQVARRNSRGRSERLRIRTAPDARTEPPCGMSAGSSTRYRREARGAFLSPEKTRYGGPPSGPRRQCNMPDSSPAFRKACFVNLLSDCREPRHTSAGLVPNGSAELKIGSIVVVDRQRPLMCDEKIAPPCPAPATDEVIYTPPEGEDVLRSKLANWERYIHEVEEIDPLIRLTVMHSYKRDREIAAA